MNEFGNPYEPPARETPVAIESPARSHAALPPLSVKLSSFVFSIFIVSPLLLIAPTRPSVMFLAFRFTSPPDPLIWVYVLSGLLTSGGWVGLAILFRRAFAYDFAWVYGIAAIAAACIFHCVTDLRSLNWANAVIQYPMLFWFTWHVGANRKKWRLQQGNGK